MATTSTTSATETDEKAAAEKAAKKKVGIEGATVALDNAAKELEGLKSQAGKGDEPVTAAQIEAIQNMIKGAVAALGSVK